MIRGVQPGRRQRWSVQALGIVATMILLAACGGSGDGESSDENATSTGGVEFSIATHTPVPPDFTPEALQTQIARETEIAQTPTAEPEQPDTNGTPEGDADPTTLEGCIPPEREGEIRAPEMALTTDGSPVCGSLGAVIWYDEASDRAIEIRPDRGVAIPDTSATAATGTPITVVTEESPYPIEAVTVTVYDFDGNVAQLGEGTDAGKLMFVPQTDPLWNVRLEGGETSFTPDLPAGEYIVLTRVEWEGPQAVEQELGGIHASSLFVVSLT